MKKLLALGAAGALLLSTVTAAFAFTKLENRDTEVLINASSVSQTGGNKQMGEGSNFMLTGDAGSQTSVLSVANFNWSNCGCFLDEEGTLKLKNIDTGVSVNASALSQTGGNKQKGWEEGSSNSLVTGGAGSKTSVASWANINLAGVEFSF